jgi:hypothetical protein
MDLPAAHSCSKTRGHKITNEAVFHMALGLHDFLWGQIHYVLRSLEVIGHRNLDFLCLNGTRFARCHFRAHGSQNGGFACIKIIKSYAIKQKVQ